MKNKKAFSLVEMSVVIIIISVLLSIAIASRSIIDMAKINSINNDVRLLNQAMVMFADVYGCRPGDCTSSQLTGVVGLNSGCTTVVPPVNRFATPLGTGQIESVVKRTCMFHEMSLGGYIKKIDTAYANLQDSISGKNIPFAEFSRAASWDFRVSPLNAVSGPGYRPIPATSTGIMPYELTTGSKYYLNTQHVFILRGSNYNTGDNYDIAFDDTNPSGIGSAYGISSLLTYKLDKKFDDGLPYTGQIRSGTNEADAIAIFETPTPGTIACTKIDLIPYTLPFDTSPYNEYLLDRRVEKGCLVAFVVDQSQNSN